MVLYWQSWESKSGLSSVLSSFWSLCYPTQPPKSGWAFITEVSVEFATQHHIVTCSMSALPTPPGTYHSCTCQQSTCGHFTNLHYRPEYWGLPVHPWQVGITGREARPPQFPGRMSVLCVPHCLPGSRARQGSGAHTCNLPENTPFICFLPCHVQPLFSAPSASWDHLPTYKINSFTESLVSGVIFGWTQFKTHFHLRNNR